MNYPNAANGLKLVFYAEILAVIGGILMILPTVGSVFLLVSGLLALVGLNRAGADEEGYRTAFMLSIVSVVVSAVSMFTRADSFMGSLVSIVSGIVSLIIIYFVCTTTSKLLRTVGREALYQRGHTVWTINLACTVLGVVLSMLMFIPILNVLAAFAGVIVGIVKLVGYVLYLMFLYGSYKAL